MRLLGVIFIVASAGSMGFRVAWSLRKRCRLLDQLMAALSLLKNEIAFCGTPLPQAFALMAAATDGAAAALFAGMAREMDRRRWLTPLAAMEQGLRGCPELPRGDPAAAALLELAAQLGKYDVDSQLRGVDMALQRLEEERQSAQRERGVKSRTYEALGICAGLAVAILLL